MQADVFYPTTPAAGTLCGKHINKSYGKQQVLKDCNIELVAGCIYGLIGRNGVGKTTLLGILTAQNTMDSGSVTYNGVPVWENRAALSQLCFSRELSSMLGMGQNPLKINEYLRAANIYYPAWDAAYADRLIKKFKLDCKKKIYKLSKGQMSMVTIIVALASRAPITILDEPVAGLDVVAREQFYQLLLEDYTETGRTFVISTHIIEEAAPVFERVLIMDDGTLIEDCPTEELIDQFRLVSGAEDALAAALAASGVQTLQTQSLGRHKMVAVRGNATAFAALAAQGVAVEPMTLQNVFVALCGHGETEG